MITRTVRIPQELHAGIEKYIAKKEYSTMADFTLHAMRYTVSAYIDKKKELSDLNKTLPGAEKKYKEVFKQMTYIYLKTYECFSGEVIQINVRVPDGLNTKIMALTKNEYGFTKKAEFLKVSLVCLLSHLDDIEKTMDETTRSDKEDAELTNKVLATVAEGIMNGKSTEEIINFTLNQFMNKK